MFDQAIPVSVIVVTKNEESRIERCLEALSDFSEVIVVDSKSEDRTLEIAADCGAKCLSFEWDGQYPKKRGWCLDRLETRNEWVFFVDADEIVHPFLADEIRMLNLQREEAIAGFFVQGQYVFNGVLLRHGLKNNKLALFHRAKFEFPVVDDLDLGGMGEIEGHYQPVLKAVHQGSEIGHLQYPLIHEAYSDFKSWEARHLQYAMWEAGMNRKNAWPKDPHARRQGLKRIFRRLPFRGLAAFVHSYVFKRGFLDGRAGFLFAKSRQLYYGMISEASKVQARAS